MHARVAAALALTAVLAGSTPGGAAQHAAPGALSVADLRCEHRTNPLAVAAPRPRLAWTVTASRRNETQSAWQVLVASSEANLAAQRGDLWDSGKVAREGSTLVVYGGRPVIGRGVCFWKVRVWDRDGRPSAWSRPARWEMAPVRSQWTATWITDGKPDPSADEDFYRDDPAPLFRREFELPGRVARARLHVTGLGYYEAYLNGARVGDQVLDPGWTAYGTTVLFSTYDVTRMLRPGRNCLGAMLGNGWYNPLPMRLFGNINLREPLTVGRPRLLAQLEVELADGSRHVVASDASWRVADGPVRFNNVYLGEVYDARREIDGWTLPGFDDGAWRRAAPANSPGGTLMPQSQPPIRVIEEIRAVAVTRPRPGVFIFDLGQNFAGWAELRLTAPAGTTVALRYGELLHADGTLNPMTSVAGQIKGSRVGKDGVARRIGGPGSPEIAWQADAYVTRGRGVEVFRPRFTFHGFRFVEMTGYPGTPGLDTVRGLRLASDLESTGSFESSSTRLNRIQEMTRRTFLSNVFSVQSDCPHREKFGYGGDIVATLDAFMLNFDMAEFYGKALTDWHDSARPDGLLPDTAPFIGLQYCGVGWGMAYPALQLGLARYYGDRQLVESHFESSRRWLDAVNWQHPNSLVLDEGLGDHEALSVTPARELVTPLYRESARLLARLAALAGRRDDEARFSALAADIRRAFAARLPLPASAEGSPDTQSARAFALYADMLEPAEREAAMRWLLDDIRSRGLTTGIFGTKFALDLLSASGHAQDVFDLVNRDTYPGWGYMLANGATTLWEHWALSDNTYSHNHPMFGSISQWFFNWLGGIQPAPDAVGFDRLVIKPQVVHGLDWVRCAYRSVRGPVAVNWTRVPGGAEFLVTIPVDSVATVYLPADRLDDVTEGTTTEVPAAGAEGVRGARVEAGQVVLTVGSGIYRFVTRGAR